MSTTQPLAQPQNPALEAGFFHAVQRIGLGTDSISIVTQGHELILPFERDRHGLVVEGSFDPVHDAVPGGVVATLPLRGIVRITLDRHHHRLTVEDRHGFRLAWRVRFLGD